MFTRMLIYFFALNRICSVALYCTKYFLFLTCNLLYFLSTSTLFSIVSKYVHMHVYGCVGIYI